MTASATGFQIKGFVKGKTQVRLAFTRRGEPIEIVCVTERLACTQLAAVESLSGWQLVSASLEPLALPHTVRTASAEYASPVASPSAAA